MNVFLILFLIFSIVYIKFKKEYFTNFKKITVKPIIEVYNPLILIKDNNMISNYIYKVLRKIIPLKDKFNIDNAMITLNKINKQPNIIGIISEYDLLNYNIIKRKNNIRLIANIFSKQFTIIYKNKVYLDKIEKIIVQKYSSAHYLLKNLSPLFNYKLLTLKKVNLNNLPSLVRKMDLPVALFISHPDKHLKKLITNNNYTLSGLSNIPKKSLESILNNYKSGFIDINYYIKEQNYIIKTAKIYNILVTNLYTKNKISYKILDSIYNNFANIKNVSDLELKKSIIYFNLSEIFFTNNKDIKLHSGTYNYFKNKGYISTIDRNICRKFVGLKSCELNQRLNPYRLL